MPKVSLRLTDDANTSLLCFDLLQISFSLQAPCTPTISSTSLLESSTMKPCTTLSFVIASASIVLVAADAAAVQTQIEVIGNYTTLLRSDVNNYNSSIQGLPWALQVQQDAVNLYRQIEQGTAMAQASGPFGEPGSSNVASSLLNITGTVKRTLDETAAKSTTFEDLVPLVLGSLYQLKASTDDFGTALTAKLAPAEQSAAPEVQAELDNSFNKAIQAYGGKSAK